MFLDSIQKFLINLLVIIISIFFLQFWMNRRGTDSRQNEYVMFLSLGFSILLCMLFPFKISNGLIFDLRFIPFLLACFYAHPITAALLGVLVTVIRVFYGGEGVWIPVIILPILFLICLQLRPLYEQRKIGVRIMITSALTLLTCTAILLSIYLFLHVQLSVYFSFSFVVIHFLGMMLSVYLVEYFRGQNLILTRLIRMEKVEVVSHLAASISHEIRNPLTTSRGFVQMVQESEDLPEKDREFLSIAMEEMDRATKIIQDYLTFAKPVSEKVEMMSTKDMIEKAIQVIQPLANMDNVIIHSQLGSNQVKGNSGHFLQVLVNILKNSIEAMPQGGTISVTSKQMNQRVHILIKDEGTGMTPLQVTRLGEPYFSMKEGKGTGLGMMVVFRVVEAMQGDITVRSEIGSGTTITISLPIE